MQWVYQGLLHMTSAYVRERPTMLPTMLRPCQLQRCKTWALTGPASKSRDRWEGRPHLLRRNQGLPK